MSAYVLMNLLNKFGKMIRCEALPSILSVFSNEFNKFSITGVQKQDSIYHINSILQKYKGKILFIILPNSLGTAHIMTLKLHFISNFALKRHDFAIRKCDVFVDVNA